MATSVSCTLKPCRVPAGCIFSTSTKCIYYSGSAIPEISIFPGNNLDTIITNISNYVFTLSVINVIVNTYADMLANATGNEYKRFLVLDDESKGAQRVTYEYWPNVGIQWIVTVDEVIL